MYFIEVYVNFCKFRNHDYLNCAPNFISCLFITRCFCLVPPSSLVVSSKLFSVLYIFIFNLNSKSLPKFHIRKKASAEISTNSMFHLAWGKVRRSEHNSELTARDFVWQISANVVMFHILAAAKLVPDELLLLLRILILAREFSRLEIIP